MILLQAEQGWEGLGLEEPLLPGCRQPLASEHVGETCSGAGGSCGILSAARGWGVCPWPRFSEPDPSHTLEERVVHWYFSQLDSNSSSDISKREMKPFKRYVKKKAKPKKCARRFTDYCDLNKDKVISLPELKGCLGVSKEGECSPVLPALQDLPLLDGGDQGNPTPPPCSR